jgi:hypothetical protein
MHQVEGTVGPQRPTAEPQANDIMAPMEVRLRGLGASARPIGGVGG